MTATVLHYNMSAFLVELYLYSFVSYVLVFICLITKYNLHLFNATYIVKKTETKQNSLCFHIVSCQKDRIHSSCNFSSNLASDRLGIDISKIDRLFNVSITTYQYLICPEGSYGPGCEQKCECAESETCHFVKGCHIGKEIIEAAWKRVGLKGSYIFSMYERITLTSYNKYCTSSSFPTKI